MRNGNVQRKSTIYERKFVSVSSKNIVYPMNFLTDLLAEHTNEIMSTTEDKEFISITGLNLPDKFFTAFLERQGLRLEGAEDIKSLRAADGESGPDKARLEELLSGLESGDVRFVLRS